MKRNLIFFVLLITVVIIAFRLIGPRIAGLLGVLGLGGNAAIKKKKEKAGVLSQKTSETKKEINKLRNRAQKLKQDGQERAEEVAKIEERIEELKKSDRDRKEKTDRFSDGFKNLLIVFLMLLGLLFFCNSFILAEEKTDLEDIQTDTEQELKINDISIPDNYEGLLEQYKETVKLALEFQDLYYEERKDKLEAIKLAEKLTHKYEAERSAHKKAEDLFRELDNRVDRLLKIIEVQEELLNEVINILDSQSGGLGFYGGIGYKPAYPLESSLDAGIIVDF